MNLLLASLLLIGSAGLAHGAEDQHSPTPPLPSPASAQAAVLAGALPGASPAPTPITPSPRIAASPETSATSLTAIAPAPSPSPSPAAKEKKSRSKKAPLKKPARKSKRRKPAPQPSASPSAQPSPAASSGPPPRKKKKAAAPVHRYLPQLLQEVEALYSQAETLKADFTQVNEIAALQQKKTSSGVILFKRPDKIRWETQKPDQNLLVSDGKKFWFYTPPFDESEHGQVIERRSAEVQSRLAQALLSGRFSVARDMKISQERATEFILKPKPGSAGTVSEARIGIDPIKRTINKVVLQHKGGNRTEITLTDIQLGKPLDNSQFEFTPPPNTDRVAQ